ncbi:MAG: hypothetical protein NTW87_31100 [Planctomycetota bacterium]|nr:hypothetical protein [Planctomycetota bacterium]
MPDTKSETPAQQTSTFGCLLRLVWMLVGNAVLMYSVIWIAVKADTHSLSVIDAVYAAGLFAVVFSRYLDIRHFNGTKGTGEPATMSDWRRFALLVVVSALVVWGAAHGVAFLRAA